MAKLTLADITNLQNETTAVTAINANSASIETALEKTLSRDGTSPNSMAATLDMNSNRIINLPVPLSDTEPLRLGDVAAQIRHIGATPLPISLATDVSGNLATSHLNTGSGASSVSFWRGDGTWGIPIATGGREILTTSRTYYVRTDGNDANTGLVDNAGGAFLTIQRAVNVIKTLDLNGQAVQVLVRPGTYTGGILVEGPFVGQGGVGGSVSINGDTTTPSNCVLQRTGGNCVTLTKSANLILNGFKLTTITSGDCINIDDLSDMYISSLDFGTCVGTHISIGDYSSIYPFGNYTISGNAQSHIHMPTAGQYLPGNITITLNGTRSWGSYFIGMRGPGYTNLGGPTFAGSGAIGGRGVVHIGAVLDMESKSTSTIPGDGALSVSKGGLVVARATSVAAGATTQTGIGKGLVWVNDGVGATALISYRDAPSSNRVIVWQNGTGFATSDPGAGSNKWWVQDAGVFTNRYTGSTYLEAALVTPGIMAS